MLKIQQKYLLLNKSLFQSQKFGLRFINNDLLNRSFTVASHKSLLYSCLSASISKSRFFSDSPTERKPKEEAPVEKKQPIVVKDETPLERAIRGAKENSDVEKVLDQPAVKKPLLQRIKQELIHYWDGTKLLGTEIGISARLVKKLLKGFPLSRREQRQLKRTLGDLARVVPMLIIVAIPFLEIALPVLLRLFPNMLPSTFESKYQAEEKKKKLLKIRLEVAKFLQDTVGEMAVAGSGSSTTAKEFTDFFNRYRTLGSQAPTIEILTVAKKFENSLTLNNLSRPQLVSLCRYMSINAFGTDSFLRSQIENRLKYLKSDDLLISNEGVDTLDVKELQQACQSRGIRTMGVSPNRLRQDLNQWLELHIKHQIPGALLLLSRAFMISETVKDNDETLSLGTAEALQATLSSLPEQAVNVTALQMAEHEGTATAKQRLQVLQEQEEMIADELEQDEAQAAIKKELLTKAPIDSETIPEKQIIQIADAVKTLTSDSSLSDVKKSLDDLKENRKEFKEDVLELHQVTQKIPAKEANVLSNRIEKMITQIDKQLDKAEAAIGSKMNLIQPDPQGRVSVEEIESVVKMLKDQPNTEQIKQIVKTLDKDGDGKVELLDILEIVDKADQKEGHGVIVPKTDPSDTAQKSA